MGRTYLQRIAYLLRRIHLLRYADFFWYIRSYLLNLNKNIRFRKIYPVLPIPPSRVLYDIQGNCDVCGYYSSGKDDAYAISNIIAAAHPNPSLKILEWGCGPVRVLQHLTAVDGRSWELWGADYNLRSINWGQKYFPHIHFMLNGLEPPISVENEFFDVVYCISVFTHLSEMRHYQWIAEIHRLLKPGGLFLGTFHGEAFRDDLTEDERRMFDSGKLVVRDKVREGKKDFSAYHGDNFMHRFLASFDIVKRLEPVGGFRQTVWTARK